MESNHESVNEQKLNLNLGLDNASNSSSETMRMISTLPEDIAPVNGESEEKDGPADVNVDEEEKDNDWLDILGSGQLLKKVGLSIGLGKI